MRQRKIKNLEEKLEAYAGLVENDPVSRKGRWRELFQETEIPGKTGKPGIPGERRVFCAEIGCGKGQFIAGMGKAHPEVCYLAVEGHRSVAYHALQKAERAGVTNVRFMLSYIDDATLVFGPGELDGIYLNFSDPWPKSRHEKRRLTSGNYLSEYAGVLRSGGFIEFRTDNDGLFDFSLEQIGLQPKMEIEEMTRDLHRDRDPETLITTEYEDKFAAIGKNINFVRIRVR
ncbi:tRNA (guanine-N7-)-methyltransferase [Eubacterium pyruvativorans]|uniref:tRNA (guanine-N(7)-)-methyltransferase n=1 Tax=Eubacterium pyruvativorans TaxID=155865 RepID=A0A1I7HKF7_9FIRM|nr:tRNA (guanosine(46)-N7)-methyltransferase TrmB [Eubacterium pyruvativorans]SFO28603.1 tRNA (guanine-N7-)-methyltransferase [Eubacterium pyruvativorans]SFU61237.1 tRNA (guanine-N7-)-methyltransferase [Eubacterium pyruvativorans]